MRLIFKYIFQKKLNHTDDLEVNFIVDLELGRSLLDQSGLMIDLQELLGLKVFVFTKNGIKKIYREQILKQAIPL